MSKWNRWQKGATLFLPLISEEQSWFPFYNWCTRGNYGQNHPYYDEYIFPTTPGWGHVHVHVHVISITDNQIFQVCKKITSAFGMVNITGTGLYEKRRSEPLLATELSIKMQNRLECWPAVKRLKCRYCHSVDGARTVFIFSFMIDKCR